MHFDKCVEIFLAKGSEDISTGPGIPPRDPHPNQPDGIPYTVDSNDQQQGQRY